MNSIESNQKRARHFNVFIRPPTGELLAPFGERGIYAGIFIATVGLGVVFHCTAVVSLLFPIVVAITESDKLPVPLHEAMAVLMMGASCQAACRTDVEEH